MNSGTSFAAAHVSGVIALMLEHESFKSENSRALQSNARIWAHQEPTINSALAVNARGAAIKIERTGSSIRS
jgi:hypothetical protein